MLEHEAAMSSQTEALRAAGVLEGNEKKSRNMVVMLVTSKYTREDCQKM